MGGPGPSLFGALPMPMPPRSSPLSCDAERVLPAGGALAEMLLPRVAIPFQRIYRKYPVAGIYSATRQKPFQFTLGTFVVPPSMTLALAEYRFQPYRFDGVLAGEAVPLEDRRLSLAIGYDVAMANVVRGGNISAEIIPGSPAPSVSPKYPQPQTGGTVFPGLPTSGEQLGTATLDTIYGIAQLNAQANGIAPGLQPQPQQPSQFVATLFGASMLPQNQDEQQGPKKFPFTYYVNENDNVTLTVGVFAPVQIPLAFFEGVLSGFLLPKVVLEAMLEKVRPCST